MIGNQSVLFPEYGHISMVITDKTYRPPGRDPEAVLAVFDDRPDPAAIQVCRKILINFN